MFENQCELIFKLSRLNILFYPRRSKTHKAIWIHKLWLVSLSSLYINEVHFKINIDIHVTTEVWFQLQLLITTSTSTTATTTITTAKTTTSNTTTAASVVAFTTSVAVASYYYYYFEIHEAYKRNMHKVLKMLISLHICAVWCTHFVDFTVSWPTGLVSDTATVNNCLIKYICPCATNKP